VSVKDVQEKDGNIYHYIEKKLQQQEVEGKLDFRRRYDFMQQHTGQHLISTAFLSKGDYPTVSVRLGDDYTSVEIDNVEISENILSEVETRVNDYIHANLSVATYWVNSENLKGIPLRRPTARRKEIRIVEIDGIDNSGCGGTHVARTGEVDLVKYIGIEKIRKQVRILWKVGKRAITDYGIKSKIIRDLSREFTCSIDEIPGAIFSLKEKLNNQISESKKYQTELVKFKAEKLWQETKQQSNKKIVCKKFENQDYVYLKLLMREVLGKMKCAVLFTNELQQKINWYAGISEDLSINLDEILPPLLKIIDGKGGGNYKFWQGSALNRTKIDDFFEYFSDSVESTLSRNL
jgi:alanyl-tRNA synthetase